MYGTRGEGRKGAGASDLLCTFLPAKTTGIPFTLPLAKSLLHLTNLYSVGID